MRSRNLWTAAGLCLAPLLGLATAHGQQLTASDPRGGPVPAAVARPQKAEPAKKDEGGCHGTSIDFVDSPREAAELAKKKEKLVFVLHVSGHFEDPRFT